MPQIYWIARDGGDPVAALRTNYDTSITAATPTCRTSDRAAYGERYGSIEWTATPQQIELFLNQVKALGLPAANFWSWQHARKTARIRASAGRNTGTRWRGIRGRCRTPGMTTSARRLT